MIRKIRRALTFSAAMLCVSCASTSKWLGPEPATHFSNFGKLSLPKSADGLTLRCLQTQAVKYLDEEGKKRKAYECIYVGVEINGLFGIKLSTPEDLNAVVEALLAVSDANCSNFLSRAFANRSAWDFGKTFAQDLATGAAAGTATVLAPAAAGLNGANLVIGKTVDSLASTYYANQTFQAMESAIKGERAQLRAVIATREDNNAIPSGTKGHATYSIEDAFSDVRGYDEVCSIREGLAQLASVANNAQTQQTKQKNSVNVAPQGDKSKALEKANAAEAVSNAPTTPLN